MTFLRSSWAPMVTRPKTAAQPRGCPAWRTWVKELLPGVQVLLPGQALGTAKPLALGDDGHLEQGVCVFQEPAHHRMVSLMVGHRHLLAGLQDLSSSQGLQ